MKASDIRIQDIMRANYVERWQLVNVSRRQTVAEHSHNVAVITREVYNRMHSNEELSTELIDTEAVVNRAMARALLHDIDEVIIGDIPTPTKQKIREQGVEVNDIIKCVDVDEYDKMVIKCADYIDSIWYLRENGVGRHAKRVLEDISDRFYEYLATVDTYLSDASTEVLDDIDNGELII